MNLILTDKPLSEALQTGKHQYVDVTKEKINPCMGCFGCWTKHRVNVSSGILL